jgi:hypothetical protein
MRYYEKTKILLSEDTLSEPKLTRFGEEFEDVDLVALKEVVLRQETFPVGTHAISLGNIATAKLLIVKPDESDITITVNGSATPIKCLAGKRSKIWSEITSLDITLTVAQEVLVLLAGE